MTKPENAVEETAGQMLQRLGTDGKLWAEEMQKHFPSVSVADLLGWCCNMIMAGYDEAERRARSTPPLPADVQGLVEALRSECDFREICRNADPRIEEFHDYFIVEKLTRQALAAFQAKQGVV